MNLLRPTVSAVTAFTLFFRASGLAHADPPGDSTGDQELPGIEPPPQGAPPPAPHTHETRPDGVTLMVVGTLAMAGGAGLIFYGYKQGAAPTAAPCGYCNVDIGAIIGGGLLSAAGLTTTIIGIVVYAGSDSEPAKKTAWDLTLPKAPGGADSAWLRAATWRESAHDVTAGVPTFAAPILSRRF